MNLIQGAEMAKENGLVLTFDRNYKLSQGDGHIEPISWSKCAFGNLIEDEFQEGIDMLVSNRETCWDCEEFVSVCACDEDCRYCINTRKDCMCGGCGTPIR